LSLIKTAASVRSLPMPRAIAVLVGICGLVAAAYLVVLHHPPAPVVDGLGGSLDYGVPFGIAIAVVSILLLATPSRDDARVRARSRRRRA
jgi:hypothetical protein